MFIRAKERTNGLHDIECSKAKDTKLIQLNFCQHFFARNFPTKIITASLPRHFCLLGKFLRGHVLTAKLFRQFTVRTITARVHLVVLSQESEQIIVSLHALIIKQLCSNLFAGATIFIRPVAKIPLTLIGQHKIAAEQFAPLNELCVFQHLGKFKIEQLIQIFKQISQEDDRGGEKAEKYSRTAPQDIWIYYRDIGMLNDVKEEFDIPSMEEFYGVDDEMMFDDELPAAI